VSLHGSEIDTSRPNMARVYDYLLGGKDNFAADREMAEDLLDPEDGCPALRELVRDNRRFIAKAVTWLSMPGIRLSAKGIRQYVDAGCGLPVHPAVHETARASGDPGARVAYVDNDPVVLTHLRALQHDGAGVAIIDGDLTDPARVLKDPALTGVIDLAEPVAVILGAVLHFRSADAAREIAAGWMAPLAAGSALVISVVHYQDPELAARMARRYTAGTLHNHSPETVTGFFGDLRLPHGGAANLRNWPLPSGNGGGAMVIGGIGLKKH